MADEITHPTYGTLKQFLADLAIDIRQGYTPRIGQMGALMWFVEKYAAQPRVQLTGATTASPGESDTPAPATDA